MSFIHPDTVATFQHWYGSDGPPAASSRLSVLRSVLIIINYLPSIDDIQTFARTNVITLATREPPFGNPWLQWRAIFTLGELFDAEKLRHVKFSDIHETLQDRILETWGICLPDTFFTFRFNDAHGQAHDIPLDTPLYSLLELHLPGWNRFQYAKDNTRIPFVTGLSQPYILRLTAHRSQ